MADNTNLELVVEVDVNKTNASIKSVNTSLSTMEQAAGKAARARPPAQTDGQHCEGVTAGAASSRT